METVKIIHKSWLRIVTLCLASIFILTIIVLTQRGYDYDIWFHLKYGQHFIHNHTWSIDHSVFSWTPATRPWTYVTWLGSSFIYIDYLMFSLPGVFAILPIVLACILLIYIYFLRSIGSSFNLTTLSLFFLIAPFIYTPAVKPAVFSKIFFPICLTIYFASRNSLKRWYWWYPLVFVIWGNTHGGFIFGLFFLCLAFACDYLAAFAMKSSKNIDKKYFLGFAASLFLSFIAISINPYGFGYLVGIARDLISTDSADPTKYISEYINLWYTLDPMKDVPTMIGVSWSVICLFALFMLLTLILIKKKYPVDIPLIIFSTVFFIFAMSYFRLIQFFALLLLFSTAYLLHRAKAFLPSKKIGLVIFASMLYYITMQAYTYVTYSSATAISFPPREEMIYPVRASRFIDEHQLPAQLINNYTLGGYIMWANYPNYKVFMDPRYWPYRKDVIDDCFSLENSRTKAEVKTILDRYPEAQTIFFLLTYQQPIAVLLHMDDWKLVYFDHTAVIFVRTSSSKSLIKPDFNATRFANIDSPLILTQLFQLYSSLNDHNNAGIIRELYDHNVRNGHPWRTNDLKFMDLQLGSKK